MHLKDIKEISTSFEKNMKYKQEKYVGHKYINKIKILSFTNE